MAKKKNRSIPKKRQTFLGVILDIIRENRRIAKMYPEKIKRIKLFDEYIRENLIALTSDVEELRHAKLRQIKIYGEYM